MRDLEPLSEGDYLINTAAPIAAAPGTSEGRFVVALYPVPQQLARLSEAVQRSYSQHGELSAQREPVKNSFRMTLTLVLLLAMLTAIYGAIYSAEKLVRPVQDLIAGTRAVGKGDFGTRLPLPSRDEMGFLVHSFNDMTKRLGARARRPRAASKPSSANASACRSSWRASPPVSFPSGATWCCAAPTTQPAAFSASISNWASASRWPRWPRRIRALRTLCRRSERATGARRRRVARADGSQARDERSAGAGVCVHAVARQ